MDVGAAFGSFDRVVMTKIVTLKKRAEFLRLRGGQRWSMPVCVVETKPSPPDSPRPDAPRFGFTITKKIGNAVVRNKIRRRLRAIVAGLDADQARAGSDYVIVVRPAAVSSTFADLARDLNEAFRRVHKPRRGKSTPPPG